MDEYPPTKVGDLYLISVTLYSSGYFRYVFSYVVCKRVYHVLLILDDITSIRDFICDLQSPRHTSQYTEAESSSILPCGMPLLWLLSKQASILATGALRPLIVTSLGILYKLSNSECGRDRHRSMQPAKGKSWRKP